MCGWLKDRYGLSWQVAPKQLGTLLSDPGTGAAVMATMLQMRKIDLAALECAAHGEPAGADVG